MASLFAMGKVASFPIEITCSVLMQSHNKKAILRIHQRGRGWVFSSNDFVADFSRDQIEKALAGLCREVKSPRIYRERD